MSEYTGLDKPGILKDPRLKHILSAIVMLCLLFGLHIVSHYNYLLFHCIAEGFSIIIACGIFMIAWNGRRMLSSHYLLFIGVAYLFVGGIDFLHTLSYKGMGVFEGYDANLPTQLWIAGRYMEAFSLLTATIFLKRKLHPYIMMSIYILATGLLLDTIFYLKIFPVCYIEGTGLTPFKIYSEYIICLIMLIAIGLLIRNRESFDRSVLILLIGSIATGIFQEIAFTTYLSVYGFSNFAGHFLKIISFYLLYRAIIRTSLVSPWNVLFNERVRMERSLGEREALLRLFVEHAPASLAMFDRDMRYITYSHRWLYDYHLGVKDLRGLSHYEVFPEISDEWRVLHKRALAGEVLRTEKDRFKRADGSTQWLMWEIRPWYDSSGDVGGIMVFSEDITARELTEQALKESNERLKLLAAVAERLLCDEDPRKVVEETCRLVMGHIDCQFFFNYLVDVPGKRMELNACAGIPEETAAEIRHLDFGVAVCGCVAMDGERIIAEDIQCSMDNRTDLVKSFGVQAYCCHPLMAQGRLLGTLSFGTKTRASFTSGEVELMKSVADQVAVAMERLQTNITLRQNEVRLRNSLEEKEALLKEIHHRVKNNMQVISSLVSLQAGQTKDPVVQDVLKDVSHRVRSMAMVHEKLYQATDLARIDFSQYIESLLSYLWHSFGDESSGISLVKDLETVSLPVDKAVPLGLILNELANNALKHAYPGEEQGEVEVSLKKDSGKGLVLTVRDYGRGLPPGLDWRDTDSLGLRLIQMLSSQLHADVEVKSSGGSEFRVILGGTDN